MQHEYWRKQEPGKPLFPDIEWSKPERKDLAGKLGIIGGNKLGFAGVAESYQTALKTGVGSAKVLLPDSLKRSVPASLLDVIYGPTNPSGGLSGEALPELQALGQWSSGILLAGDAAKNSETALLYENFVSQYEGQLTITRDAIDLLTHTAHELIERDNTTIVASFAQAQKLFRAVHYPKMLTFNMTLLAAIEAMHKFTITYPVAITVLHKDTLVISHQGNIVTQAWDSPMAIWRGETAAKIASYQLWTPDNKIRAIATAIA